MACIFIQLCICFDKALLSLRACMVYWGHSLSHYTKSYLVIQLEIKAVAIRIYNGHLYFLKSTTTSLISPIPHCSRCQQKVLLDQQVCWGKWSRFPRCVLSALSGNANENQSTDKVSRAINWGKRPIPPSQMLLLSLLVSSLPPQWSKHFQVSTCAISAITAIDSPHAEILYFYCCCR